MNRRYFRALIESGISGRPMPFQYKKDGRIEVDSVCLQDVVQKRLSPTPPPPKDIVYEETLSSNQLNLIECWAWAKKFDFVEELEKLSELEPNGQVVVTMVNKMVSLLDFSHRRQELMINETPAARVQKIINDLATDLSASDRAKASIEELMHSGVLRFLEKQNIKSMADLNEDGALCKPTVTYELRQSDVETGLRGWVLYELLKRGQVDTLAVVLALRSKG